MKHLKNLLFLSILCPLLVFTNCGEDEVTCATCSIIYSNQLDAFGNVTELTGKSSSCIGHILNGDTVSYADLQTGVDNGECTWD